VRSAVVSGRGVGALTEMNTSIWEIAVMIACPRTGEVYTIANADDALRLLTSAWPVAEGRDFFSAIEMCGESLGTFSNAEMIASFTRAAKEAGVAYHLITPPVVV
jgi:hypothetical protein